MTDYRKFKIMAFGVFSGIH